MRTTSVFCYLSFFLCPWFLNQPCLHSVGNQLSQFTSSVFFFPQWYCSILPCSWLCSYCILYILGSSLYVWCELFATLLVLFIYFLFLLLKFSFSQFKSSIVWVCTSTFQLQFSQNELKRASRHWARVVAEVKTRKFFGTPQGCKRNTKYIQHCNWPQHGCFWIILGE